MVKNTNAALTERVLLRHSSGWDALFRRGRDMADTPDFIRQAAAIPIRAGQICLVTSSSGKRWVIPKGMIEPGATAGQIALQEAWEEAGLVGVLHPEAVGTYLYEKWGGTHFVTVFLMDVTDVALYWPERPMRQREWVSGAEALDRIGDEGLRELIRSVAERCFRDQLPV
jgi:8-oxo-dGTP pyrophosphatase MutT (NUDIX family)